VEEKQTGAYRRPVRLEGVVMIKDILTAIGVYTVGMCLVRIVLALMGDRSGNSGRYKRWDEEDD